jgi:SAM-dependent methyltransferase
MSEENHGSAPQGTSTGLHRRWLKAIFLLTPWGLKRSIKRQQSHADQLAGRADEIEEGIRALQRDLVGLGDDRMSRIEHRLDDLERAVSELGATAARLRDQVVPAVIDRGNLLVNRLSEEIEEVASLVERSLRREPLPVPDSSDTEDRIAAALAGVQPLLTESFRGSEEEIRHRLDRYLETLRASEPVLDLGCGRGELLLMLREAGVEARGVEQDPALAQAARRRGLAVIEGDAVEYLRSLSADSLGAVTAIHLVEHLGVADLLSLLAEARRVLRPGGTVVLECPNPHNLRVGAALYWLDPTHRRPLLPETLELYCVASGLEVKRTELLHPFPAEQRFAESEPELPAEAAPGLAELAGRLDRVAARLDELLNGPRDFALVAVKSTES